MRVSAAERHVLMRARLGSHAERRVSAKETRVSATETRVSVKEARLLTRERRVSHAERRIAAPRDSDRNHSSHLRAAGAGYRRPNPPFGSQKR
jgi:hypothetical protein